MQRQRHVIANWKMNSSCSEVAQRLQPVCRESVALSQHVKIVVCPPDIHLLAAVAARQDSTVSIGAQNLSRHNPTGAYTGEVSAWMLGDAGCEYVIVGHSERRVMHRESNEIVAEKFATAISADLIPILCVGEHQSERHSGDAERVVGLQLETVFANNVRESMQNKKWLVAYEPVWAIGSGTSASPQDAENMHLFIRSRIAEYNTGNGDSTPILYGGSINQGNAAELFAMPNVDGGLVGGSSLDSKQFLSICKSI
ncbi:MAG: triose-phosphate isomerase [Candidatus Porifericomitaceae bacterium WSBS_2022_MAG_OTU9]